VLFGILNLLYATPSSSKLWPEYAFIFNDTSYNILGCPINERNNESLALLNCQDPVLVLDGNSYIESFIVVLLISNMPMYPKVKLLDWVKKIIYSHLPINILLMSSLILVSHSFEQEQKIELSKRK